jgi:cytochrome b involved in lipid metabolism
MERKLGLPIGIIAVVIIGILSRSLLKKSSGVPAVQGTSTTLSQSNNSGDPAQKYSLQDVVLHKDATSCWSVINGKVYDLTAWINQHPGGSIRILSICGIDGSAAFNVQHGGQSRPNSELRAFYIGDLFSN